MSINIKGKTVYGPNIVTDGLVLYLDAANTKSYPGSGTTWYDLSGNNKNFSISDINTFAYNSSGYFTMTGGGINCANPITDNLLCTCVFWIKTTDVQSLFWSQFGTTSYYLGAYRIGNKFYNNAFGSPTYHQDSIQKSNIYDNLIDDNWHMVEFKSVNLAIMTKPAFNHYSSFIFNTGDVAIIQIYNRNITESESRQNYNAMKGRYL